MLDSPYERKCEVPLELIEWDTTIIQYKIPGRNKAGDFSSEDGRVCSGLKAEPKKTFCKYQL